jgi:hypothetical protein
VVLFSSRIVPALAHDLFLQNPYPLMSQRAVQRRATTSRGNKRVVTDVTSVFKKFKK